MIDAAVVIPTLNEGANIGRTLASLGDFREVLIVDSGSIDATVVVASGFPNVRVVEHQWEGYGPQKNWAADQLRSDPSWVLFLDADEWLPLASVKALDEALATMPAEVAGLALRLEIVFMGRVLAGLSPNGGVIRAVRPGCGRFESRGINEYLIAAGEIRRCGAVIRHEDLKPVSSWVARQVRYMELEAQVLSRRTPPKEVARLMPAARRVRYLRERVWPYLPAKPLLAFLYYILFRGLWREGAPGVRYSIQQAVNQFHVSMFAADLASGVRPLGSGSGDR